MTEAPAIAIPERNSVLIPLGDVEHGNVNRMALDLAQGLNSVGLDTPVIDYRQGAEAAFRSLRDQLDGGQVRGLMAMNGVGFPTAGHDELAALGVGLVVFGTDHPCHLYPLMEAAPAGCRLSFPTASNIAFAERYMRADLGYLHVPHAAPVRARRPWPERDIPVLLVGNLRQGAADARAVWETRGAETPVLHAMHELYRNGPAPSLEQIGEEALRATGARDSDLAQPRAFAKILRYFDPAARAELRETVLGAIVPFDATIAGDWRGLVNDPGGQCRFIGPQDADAVSDLVGRAKIVVNAVPGYYRSHERIFDAMAAGAVTVNMGPTDFPDLNAGTGVFDIARAADTGQLIGELLADDGKLRELGEAAATHHQAHHTWAARAPIIRDVFFTG